MQLFCLPPAGSGANTYLPWKQTPTDGLSIEAISLPGRESRISESIPETLEDLASLLCHEIIPAIRGPYCLFGYSMGALLAYEIAIKLQSHQYRLPEKFFALAASAPQCDRAQQPLIHELTSEAFNQQLSELGGTPSEVLASPELMELFEPILRQDFKLCETYQASGQQKLDCPIFIFEAKDDSLVPAEHSAPWQDLSLAYSKRYQLPGGHMLNAKTFASLLPIIKTLSLS